ncbi:MAG: hypothetical protein V3V19_11365 [Cocleimonas sp.]
MMFSGPLRLTDKRQEKLEKKLLNSVVDYWRKEIMPVITDIKSNLDLNASISEITQSLYTELYGRVESHLRNILRLGFIEGSRREYYPKELIDIAFNQVMKNTKIEEGIVNLAGRLASRLTQIPELMSALIDPAVELEEILKSIAISELRKYETVNRTDSQYVINQGRMIEWNQRDPRGTYLFGWSIGRDHRTTDCCKEIKATVEAEGMQYYNKPGVPLSRLIQIVDFVGAKHFPKFDQRELNPHWNCRSAPRRIV